MDGLIVVKVDRVYGNICVYPVSDNARIFCELTNKKTLNYRELSLIEALGYEIRVEQSAILNSLDKPLADVLQSEAR